jgi:hypothetical protein
LNFLLQLQVANTSIMERDSQLANLQNSLDQKRASYETLDESSHREKVRQSCFGNIPVLLA